MNWNTNGTWLEGEHPEAETGQASVTFSLPDDTQAWNDSTVDLQRIHDVLATQGWGRGPI